MIKIPNNNYNLHTAKRLKNDEFFTMYEDVEKECEHYLGQFKDQIVYCNTDNPDDSNFWKYFYDNFHRIGLKKLVSTYYSTKDVVYKTTYDGVNLVKDPLKGNGDFRNQECIELLKEADIVVTNPPFSLFREYIEQLMEYNKKFIIIGNQNAITYKEIFPLLKSNKIWLGASPHKSMSFRVPDYYEPRKTRYWEDETGQKWRSFGNICWFTNLEHTKRHEKLILWKTYNSSDYPKYDNYNAIEVNKTDWIPEDYFDEMGVPITFMDKYCPEQFEIVGGYNYSTGTDGKPWNAKINGKYVYARILIKRK